MNSFSTSDLYSKKEAFTKEEIKFLKSKIKKSSYRIKYGFYRKESKSGCQLAFIIDSSPFATRRSGVENNWEIFCEREISDLEYHEEIENYGCNVKRFKVFYYKDIGYLIHEDLKYKVNTPEPFINECIKRGFNGNFQTKMDFKL